MTNSDLTRQHLWDILQSPLFLRSAKLSLLLERLVEPVLTESGPIKEQILGIEVFERPADWDPQTDAIVRVHTNRLRSTLKAYYAGQTDTPPVRFEIPKGSYTVRCIADQRNPLDSPATKAQASNGSGTTGPRLRELRIQRLTTERGDVTNAVFTPDGEHVVFSVRWRGEPVSIHYQGIGQKYSRPLGLPPGEVRDVSATGQLLFTLGETSMGVLAQAELSGVTWHEIVENVTDANWLPDNRSIAAARVENGCMRLELPLGNPIYCLKSNQARTRLSIDPTGQQVAFVDSSLGSVDFCTADRNGQAQRISKGWRVTGGIQWLSDDRLVISGARRGTPAIHTLDLQGHEESFYPTPVVWNLHDCSPKGRILASSVDSRLKLAYRTPSMHAEGYLFSVANSRLVGITPDARHVILMDLLADGDSGAGEARNSPILLAALPNAQPAQIAEGNYPQLSADGKAVICVEHGDNEDAIVVTPIPLGIPRRHVLKHGPNYHSAEFIGATSCFLVNVIVDEGQLKSHVLDACSGNVTPVPGGLHLKLVAPNGNSGVVHGGPDLRLANLETGAVRSICALRPGWYPIRWSSNSNDIFVYEPGTDYATAHLTRISTATGQQQALHTLHPTDSIGVYTLPWVDVTPDGHSYAYTYQQDLSDLYILDGLV